MRSGSVADTMRDMLDDIGYSGSYKVRAVDNVYVRHASVQSSLKALGLDADGMVGMIG